MRKKFPKIIQEVGFDFDWKVEKVWKLDVPTEKMDIAKLIWHFSIPFLWKNGGVYNLTPQEVLGNPDVHKKEYSRMMKADMQYPIDIMENKGRWLILDGLHRLMKAFILKQTKVNVRKISRDKIPKILKD